MKKLFVLSFIVAGVFVASALFGVVSASALTTIGTCVEPGCGAANALSADQACTCGTGLATEAKKWCNASKNAGFESKTACEATAGTVPTGSGLEIPFVKEGLRGIQTQGGPDTIEKVGTYIGTIGNYMFTFLMAAAVILIIWGAFDFIAGGGDPKRIETARQKIMWAFVGIAIALLAVFFAPIVQSFLQVKK